MHRNYIKSKKKKDAKFHYRTPEGKHIKKPPSGYQLWVKYEFVPSLSAEQKKTYIKDGIASKAWKQTSDNNKQKWFDQATTLKTEYNKNKSDAYLAAIDNGTFKEPKPKKPSSGYLIYCNSDDFKEHIKDMPFDSFQDTRKYSGSKWNLMTAEEREPFITVYNKNVEKYKITLNDYFKRQIEREERLKSEAETQ